MSSIQTGSFSRRAFAARLLLTCPLLLLNRGAGAWINARNHITSKELHMLTVKDFHRVLGQTFWIQKETGEKVAAQLIEASLLGKQKPSVERGMGKRDPFSIVFQAQPQNLLKQQIYQVRHDELGALEIFLVPISADERGTRCEAVFG